MTRPDGKVMTKLTLWNNTDLDLVARGMMKPEDVRTETVEALVDTGATQLVLPLDLCRRLGFSTLKPATVRLADGKVQEIPHAGSIRLSILGREMECDALVMPPGTRALIGQVQLEVLDLIVDARSQEVRANPAHPDAPIIDLLAVA
jgi:clan AA aspartic protease